MALSVYDLGLGQEYQHKNYEASGTNFQSLLTWLPRSFPGMQEEFRELNLLPPWFWMAEGIGLLWEQWERKIYCLLD